MNTGYCVALNKIIKDFSLKVLSLPEKSDDIMVSSADINRPGLQLIGFFEHFDPNRIQVLGKVEFEYIMACGEETAKENFKLFIEKKPVAVIITRSLPVSDFMIEIATEYSVPMLSTEETTSVFAAGLISYLSVELAPRITQHGVLVEVYGEGLLLIGESGVGKSETAIELIKRGHRLIADDAVEIRKVSNKTLVGTSPDNIRHFIELRGIGIINARRIFGMGAVKQTEKIDMVITMEQWDSNKVYDRMGIDNETVEILDLTLPSLTIPVKPGRNLAVIIEVAAMNNRQKKMGYNAAKELLKRLGMDDDTTYNAGDDTDWTNY